MEKDLLNDGPQAMDALVPPGQWFNRNVIGMGLTSLLSDAGHEMATAILPAFLAALGAPAYALGLIEGVSDALASFVKLGAGWWSDRIGHRKGIATGGYFLTGAAKALFALAYSWPLILFARALAWFGAASGDRCATPCWPSPWPTPTGARRSDFTVPATRSVPSSARSSRPAFCTSCTTPGRGIRRLRIASFSC